MITQRVPTSRLKSTPPMGDPKATDIPAAAAAESTSRFRAEHQIRRRSSFKLRISDVPSLPLMLTNNFMKTFAQQHATCTSGPSLPSHIPDATDRHYLNQYLTGAIYLTKLTSPRDLITNVQIPMKRRITKPPNIVLISGIPLCFAYKEYSWTKTLEIKAKDSYSTSVIAPSIIDGPDLLRII